MMGNLHKGIFCYLFLALGLAESSGAAEQKSFAGIYSSLAYNEESGDLGGMELLLIPTGDKQRYVVAIQVSEGQQPEVMVAHIQVKSGTFDLSFKMSLAMELQRMTCKFEGTGIACSAADGHIEKLKRGKSYWQ